MSGSIKRQLAVAAATAGIATVLWHAAIPDQHRLSPEGRRQAAEEQYKDAWRAEQARRRAEGKELGDAVQRDRLRPAEARPAEHAADDIARRLLRRVP